MDHGTTYERVMRVLLERIGSMGAEEGLWRVALEFVDGTTKPEGMFTDPATARAAAEDIGNSWGCPVEERSQT